MPSGPVKPSATFPTGPPSKRSFQGRCILTRRPATATRRLPRGTLLLGLVEWTITPRLQSLYSAGHLSASCRWAWNSPPRCCDGSASDVRSSISPKGVGKCGVRRLVTVDHGYVPELRVVCSSPSYSFTSWQVNIIVLEAEGDGSATAPGRDYLVGDAVPIGPHSGQGALSRAWTRCTPDGRATTSWARMRGGELPWRQPRPRWHAEAASSSGRRGHLPARARLPIKTSPPARLPGLLLVFGEAGRKKRHGGDEVVHVVLGAPSL